MLKQTQQWHDINWLDCQKRIAILQYKIVVALKDPNKLAKSLGGNNTNKNLVVLHRECHKQVTHSKGDKLRARFSEKGITRKK